MPRLRMVRVRLMSVVPMEIGTHRRFMAHSMVEHLASGLPFPTRLADSARAFLAAAVEERRSGFAGGGASRLAFEAQCRLEGCAPEQLDGLALTKDLEHFYEIMKASLTISWEDQIRLEEFFRCVFEVEDERAYESVCGGRGWNL